MALRRDAQGQCVFLREGRWCALHRHFGYKSFRPLQQEVIEHVVQGDDALVLMPTGGGKSLCYQIPALAFQGLTVVVSPLIALMKDQVQALQGNGIPAAFLNSSLEFQEEQLIRQQLRMGELKLLYVSPERLFQQGFRRGHCRAGLRELGLAQEQRIGLALAQLLPTLRYDMMHESDALRDARFAHYGRIRETASVAENAPALAAFLSISVEAARALVDSPHPFSD